MTKLVVLIADDQRVHRKQVIEWFIQQPLLAYFSRYIECKYIKQNVVGELNFEMIIEELEHLHVAFVDMQWYEDGFNGWEGGFYIIDKLESKFPSCLIIPTTQFRFSQEIHPDITSPTGKRYDALPKDGDDFDKTTRFFSYLEKWQVKRIKQIKNTTHWCKILSAIEISDFTEKVIIDDVEWTLSDFIFPEITIENYTFFQRDKFATEIRKLVSYPKTNPWGSENSWGKHTETYFKFLEIDEKRDFRKLLDIQKSAKEYIENFVFLLNAKDNKTPVAQFSNKAKTQQLRSHQCKVSNIPSISDISRISDIPDDYYDNLLIRYIVLTLCHIADKAFKQHWKLNLSILNLFDHANESSSDINKIAKNFYYFIGINTDRSSKSISYKSYTENIFYTEKYFLQNFDFQSILDKITVNN